MPDIKGYTVYDSTDTKFWKKQTTGRERRPWFLGAGANGRGRSDGGARECAVLITMFYASAAVVHTVYIHWSGLSELVHLK